MIYTTQGDVRDETFDTCVFWLRAIVSSSPNIGAEGPPLVACPRLLIQYNRISRTSPPATWRLTQKSCPATRKSLALCQCELCQVNPSNSFLSRVLPPLLISSLCAVWCRFRLRDCKLVCISCFLCSRFVCLGLKESGRKRLSISCRCSL